MTDTTITLPIANVTVTAPVKGLTWAVKLALAAGSGLVAALAAYSRAVELAYCGPYQKPVRYTKHGLDEDLEGRDPNW